MVEEAKIMKRVEEEVTTEVHVDSEALPITIIKNE